MGPFGPTCLLDAAPLGVSKLKQHPHEGVRYPHEPGVISGLFLSKGEIILGRPCGSVAQLADFSQGMRGVLGLYPSRALCFFLPFDIYMCATAGRMVSNFAALLLFSTLNI